VGGRRPGGEAEAAGNEHVLEEAEAVVDEHGWEEAEATGDECGRATGTRKRRMDKVGSW
jgi:hypothetical protein